jgi:hypothetical protein
MPKTSTKPKSELLYAVLADGTWHSTRELVRLVGHTFAGAKKRLVDAGYAIEKRRHPHRRNQWQYRMEA